jgi:hypothetical protein
MALLNQWKFREQATINGAQCAGVDNTQFPVLLVWTGSQSTSNFPQFLVDSTSGYACQASGADLRFSSDPAGATLLPFDIAHWNGISAGGVGVTAEIWVQVPDTSGASNKSFYIWGTRGDVDATKLPATDTYGRNAVWSNSFQSVYHLDQTSYVNSQGFAPYDGTNYHAASATTGVKDANAQFGWGGKFDGTSEIVCGSNMQLTRAFTLSAIVQAGTNPAQASYAKIICKSHTANSAPYCMYNLLTDASTGAAKKIRFEMDTTNTQRVLAGTTDVIPQAGRFLYAACTYDGIQTMKIWSDGTANGSLIIPGGPDATNSQPTCIGAAWFSGSPTQYWSGIIDEARTATVARSTSWLQTEYNNMFTPTTFITLSNPTKFSVYETVSSCFIT